MLLILVLSLLFCPSLAEEDLRSVKQKNTRTGHTMCNDSTIRNKKKKSHSISTKDPHPSSIAFGPLSPSFYPQRERHFPFGPVVGEEGFEPPTPWFVATCSNPLSYRPHLVSSGSVPGSTLIKKRTLSSPQPFPFRVKKMRRRVYLYKRCVPRCEVGERGCHNWGFE